MNKPHTYVLPSYRSNRTFMELKWRIIEAMQAKKIGSNRTFMELK